MEQWPGWTATAGNPTAAGAEPCTAVWGRGGPWGAGGGDTQTRLAGHAEPSAIEMRHLPPRLLRPREIAVTTTDKCVFFLLRTSSKLGYGNVLLY